MKNGHLIIVILFLLSVASSGCVNEDNRKLETLENEVQNLKEQIKNLEKQQITPVPTPPEVDSVNLTNETLSETIITPTPILTPFPTTTQQKTYKKLPSNFLYVSSEMEAPIDWGNGRYELKSLRVKIMNQQNNPLSIKAQIINEEQVLEEKSFTLEKLGSGYEFANEKQHFINNTNVTLKLLVQDYEPIDYNITILTSLN